MSLAEAAEHSARLERSARLCISPMSHGCWHDHYSSQHDAELHRQPGRAPGALVSGLCVVLCHACVWLCAWLPCIPVDMHLKLKSQS